MKKSKIILMSIVAVYCLAISAVAAFSDVDENAYYADAVEYVSSQGIITGYSDGSFHPNSTVTRAELSAVICRMMGYSDGLSTNGNIFSDVPASSWANGYITKAASLNVINGFPDGTFRPNSTVEYNQAITMLIRAFGLREEAEQAGGYPNGYVAIAEKNDLLDGIAATKGKPLSRADIAIVIWNFYTGGNSAGGDNNSQQSEESILAWITEDGTYWGRSNTFEGALHFRQDQRMGYWDDMETSALPYSLDGNYMIIEFRSWDTDDVIDVTYTVDCFESAGKKYIRLEYVGADSGVTQLGGVDQFVSGEYVQKTIDSETEKMLEFVYDLAESTSGGEKMLSDDEIYEYLVAHYKKGTADEPGDGITVWEGSSNGTSYYETQARCGVPGNLFASQPLYWITVDKETNVVTEENAITGAINYYILTEG